MLRLRGAGNVGAGDVDGGGEDGACMWVKRNELRSELMSVLDESAQRLRLYEEMVYRAANLTSCMLARDMWSSEHEYFVRHVRQLRELLDQWSDESM